MQLVACSRCNRHIRVSATRCPFCGSVASRPVSRLIELGGRLSRAAVFAGTAACWTSAQPTQGPPPPPPPPPDDVVQQPPPDNGFAKPPDGDAPPDGNASANGTTGSVTGYAREAGTMSPLANTYVSLAGNGVNQNTRTGPDGHYEFKNLPPGRYQVMLHGNGNPRQAPPMRWVEVKAGATARADLETYPYVPDRGPCCKPYGAPPARRRVV